MSKITWMHISDLHFRASSQATWEANIVLKALLDDLQILKDSEGLKPDLIMVSGDIVFSGVAEEYTLAKAFFDNLLEVYQVRSEIKSKTIRNED